ncbi:MAG: hypothetical protein A2675_04000 [Candidatus Yonathbacteria bacterium RIFCSPHIGHO2_01_FULL_51_10]|uniref:Uncharacterized protein n=1 Tax=Candidatus Yonathbacteria bacterium RIFCSPHIGHO2_01_FULL_51_10 TaxID=1802723 RepID=A0A1G2S3U2_9BACT|nr:MAG: hypothetical protein A2675_04000 [Candidatus Yonathbacteria bacterium RIFCSPHIGHO2_01_FULL_51_10]
MTPEKICSVVALYRARFEKEGIPKQRMDPQKFFSSQQEMLAHAHYLTDTTEEYACDPELFAKANRHLASLQTLLWTAEWYTLADLMNHNRP